MTSPVKTQPFWTRPRAMGLGLAGLIGLLAILWKFCGPIQSQKSIETNGQRISQGPPHPGLVIQSPFLNVRPEVGHVGAEVCTTCHDKIAQSYRAHPMGRSIARAGRQQWMEQFGETFHSRFSSGRFTFEAQLRGEKMIHRETLVDPQGKQVAELAEEIGWVVGSGTRGRSYLVDHDGFLFQSPLAWYVETKRWDLSPQYEKANLHFGRPITAECLFCHCDQAEPVASSVNRYSKRVFHDAAIGCERCHGPGELHVANQTNNPTDTKQDLTIANPGKMGHQLRQDVCWQCHLQSAERVVRRGRQMFDYRPGLPLDEFLRDYVKAETDQGESQFVGAVPQMLASRCYQVSGDPVKLGCTSCHDPHGLPSESNRVDFYRQRCLTCHEKNPCGLSLNQRQTEKDNCIACHMPRKESRFPHLSITDHRVLRKPSPVPVAAFRSELAKSNMPLVPLHHVSGSDGDRDLGVALQAQADKRPLAEAQRLVRLALPLLKVACAADPDDVPPHYAQAKSLWYLGQKTDALKIFDSILERFPDEENSLYNAAVLATQTGTGAKSLEWAIRLVKNNPWRWEYHKVLAEARALSGDRKGAESASRAALRLYPAGLLARPAQANTNPAPVRK